MARCADCELQDIALCAHNHPTPCVHCKHREDRHVSQGKGECIDCDCDGLETR